MAEQDLEPALAEWLAAQGDDRHERIRRLSPGAAAKVVEALGRERSREAATLLAAFDEATPDAGVRKAARRALHRLRSIGIVAERRSVPERASEAPSTPGVTADAAWATSFDPNGSRALWLTGERALGGIWLAGFILNDREGLRDLELTDSTRKRFRRDLDDWRRDPYSTWVELPPEYAMRLLREGVVLARNANRPLPTSYPRFRDLFGEAESGPERPLAFETVSPLESTFNPEWLTASDELLSEREVAIWRLDPPDDLREKALSVVRGQAAPILVLGGDPPSQAWQLVAQSAELELTPEQRRALRRRLEETAYIFLQTDRLRAARLAVAASQAIGDATVPVARQPLPLELALNGFLWALRAEEAGGMPAGEEFYQLAHEGREAAEETGATTTSSGLILPGR